MSLIHLNQSFFGEEMQVKLITAGQITATSHDLTPKGGLVREPYFKEILVGDIFNLTR